MSHWLKQIHTICTKNKHNCVFILLLLAIVSMYSYGLMWLPPEYDEVLVANAALNCPSNVFIEQVIWFNGQCIPIMLSSYIGGVMVLPERIIFTVFGSGLLQLRVTRLAIAILSLLLLYAAAFKYKNRKFALLFLAILFLDFQLWSNLRFESTVALPFFLKSLWIYLILLFLQSKKKDLLLVIGFLTAVAIWAKFDAVFFYISLLVSVAIVYRKNISLVTLNWKKYAYFLVGLGIGSIPLAFYVFKNTTRFIFIGKEVGSSSVTDALFPKIKALFYHFSGYDDIWYLFRHESNPPLFISLLLIVILFFFLASIVFASKQKNLRVFAGALITFVCLYIIYGGLKLPHHRLLIYPIPHFLLAIYLYQKKVWIKVIFFGVFSAVFIQGHIHFIHSKNTLEPKSAMSYEIYSLAKYLDAVEGKVIIGDWGVTNQLLLLSRNYTNFKEIAFSANTQDVESFSDELRVDLKDCAYIVLRRPDLAIFTQANKNLRSAVVGELVYTDNVFEVYSCESK